MKSSAHPERQENVSTCFDFDRERIEMCAEGAAVLHNDGDHQIRDLHRCKGRQCGNALLVAVMRQGWYRIHGRGQDFQNSQPQTYLRGAICTVMGSRFEETGWISSSSAQFGITWTRLEAIFRVITCVAICCPTTTLALAAFNDRSRRMEMIVPAGLLKNGTCSCIATSG